MAKQLLRYMKINKYILILIAVFVLVLVFSRFYNIPHTARFTEDESGFLVTLHQIFIEKKLTLVGQVNEQGTKVFGSLSIYLLMPFAILGNFNPISVFYGAAFWGVLIGLVMLYLGKLINKKLIYVSAILILVWFPLLQTGRWAWNPNFIPFWVALGIVCYLKSKNLFFSFMSGIFFGLSIHQHYYAIFGTSIFIFIIAMEALIRKNIKNVFLPGIGFVLTLLPFLIFDLRHPPGLFILGAAKQAHVTLVSQVLGNFLSFSAETLKYYTQSLYLAVGLAVVILGLFIFDIVKKNRSLLFFIPCIFQILLISILGLYFTHYFFVIIPFFFVWIIYPRKRMGKYLSYTAISILIIGGLISFVSQITRTNVHPDLQTVVKITSVLENEIKSEDLKNVNIVVLASPDHNTEGRKYRDLLLVSDNLQIKSTGEYSITDNLFVISTASESIIRADPATEISNFRSGKLSGEWQIDNSPWVVYLLNRNTNEKSKK